MVLQLVCKADGVYFIAETFLHRLKHILRGGVFLFKRFLFILAVKVQVVITDIYKLFTVVFRQHFKGEFIDIFGKVKYFKALILYRVGLREHINLFVCLAAGIIDRILPLLHSAYILFKGNILLLV